ncbi:MAG: FecR domain-containing protein [Polyangiales bacterium]
MTERLENLGAEVARVQDETLADDRRRASVRRRLLTGSASARPRAPWKSWRPALGFAAACAAAAAVLLSWPSTPEPVGYRVDDGAELNATDEPIVASNDQALRVTFSDDSWIRLTPGSRAHISELTSVGASVTLENGEATVYVRHRKETRWSVQAGPFLVRVTGTRFRVGWSASSQTFELDVFEGNVEARGPKMEGRIVRDGGTMRITLQPEPAPEPTDLDAEPLPPPPSPPVHRSPDPATHADAPSYRPPGPAPAVAPAAKQLEPSRAETSTPEPPEPPEPEVSEESLTDPEPEPTPPALAPAPAAGPTWEELFSEGEHEKALAILGPEQVEEAIWRGDSKDLIDLGAAARRTGDVRAGYIYSAVRSRFPGTVAAANAAFLLARMEFHTGRLREAATWMETYLRERPDGRFAREAAGRLVEAYQQVGDESLARIAAERYLARYPNGPHAELARSVLQ